MSFKYEFETSLIGDFLASADIYQSFWLHIGKAAFYWPHTFLHPGCFVKHIITFCKHITALWKYINKFYFKA